jgi:osmotically-inducible protein OsmY
MFRILTVPVRLTWGVSRLSARTGFAAGRLSARTSYRTARRVGLGRLVFLAAGVGIGLLVAPTSGAELRDRLRQAIDARRADQRLSDAEVAVRVREALSQSPRTWHLPQPAIDVVDGTAILTGDAPHPSGKADIEQAVAAVPGVIGVDSRLVVASSSNGVE